MRVTTEKLRIYIKLGFTTSKQVKAYLDSWDF